MPQLPVSTTQQIKPQTDQFDPMQRMHEANAGAWAQEQICQTKVAFEKGFSQISQPEKKDQTITEKTLKSYDEAVAKTIDAAPTETSRDVLGGELLNYRSAITQRALEQEAITSIDGRKSSFANVTNIGKSRVSENPALIDDAINDVDGAALYLPEHQREDFTNKAKRDVATSALLRQAQMNPKEIDMYMEGFAHKDLLTDEDKGLIKQEAKKTIVQNDRVSRQKIVETSNNIDNVKKKLHDGYPLKSDEIAALRSQIESIDDPAKKEEYSKNMEYINRVQELWETGSPQDIQNRIDDIAEDDSEEAQEEREFYDKNLKQMKSSSLEYASKRGIVEMNNVDFKNPSTLQERKKISEVAAQEYETEPQIFTEKEIYDLSDQIGKSNPLDSVEIANNLKSTFGNDAFPVLEKLSKNSPVEAHALGMIIDEETSTEAAKEILNGSKILKERPDLKQTMFKDEKVFKDTYKEVSGNTLGYNKGLDETVYQSANAWYASQASKLQKSEFDRNLYEKAIHYAVGGTEDPRSGIRQINGRKTVLPAGVIDDDFERYIVGALPEDIQDKASFEQVYPGGYAIYVDGIDITNGQPVEISHKDIKLARSAIRAKVENPQGQY